MPPDNASAAAPVAPASQPPVGADTAGLTSATNDAATRAAPPTGNATPPTTPPADDETPQLSAEAIRKMQDALKKANKEAERYRLQVRVFEDAQKAAALAGMSEPERTAAQQADQANALAELQAKYEADTKAARDRILSYEVQLAATKLGIIDPDAATLLLDRASLEFDDTGKPKNVEKQLRALAQAKPWLTNAGQAAASTPSVSPANPARNQAVGATTFSRVQIAAMTPEEYKQNRAAIFAATRAGRLTDG